MSNAIDIQLANDFGGTMLWPMIALSNIAQGSAVLGMVYLQRKNEEAQEVNIPSMISCYLGVTEPAMFGVNLKYVFPFICGMVGSSLAAIISTATSVTAASIGVGGLPGILSIQPQYWLNFLICMVVAIVVPFVLTVIVGKRKNIGAEEVAENVPEVELQDTTELKAPVNGKVVKLSDVNDEVFSSGAMGDGVGIIPSDETVYAPADAIVSSLIADSKHAVGLTLTNGIEVLIHVGVDTVAMNGDGFEYLVTEGQAVRAGTPLLTFSKKKIAAAGHPDTVIMIVTETNDIDGITMHSGMDAKTGVDAVATW